WILCAQLQTSVAAAGLRLRPTLIGSGHVGNPLVPAFEPEASEVQLEGFIGAAAEQDELADIADVEFPVPGPVRDGRQGDREIIQPGRDDGTAVVAVAMRALAVRIVDT